MSLSPQQRVLDIGCGIGGAARYIASAIGGKVMVLAFFEKHPSSKPTTTDNKPPALGVHLVMKEQAKEKFENTLANIKNGYIAPVQMIALKQ